MKKTCAALIAAILVPACLYAQNTKKTAASIKEESLSQESVQDAVIFLKNSLDSAATPADKRSILYFTGTMQEQLGLYSDACKSYAKAAGIAAADAAGMPKVSSEQLVINAVRTSLCSGDWETADSYLNSAVRSSKNKTILAYVNLYSVWSSLCKATSVQETQDSVSLLKAYSAMESMKDVRPAVLLTLWYLTSDAEYSAELRAKYPSSPETAITEGNAQIMSVPFWYFVPRNTAAQTIPATDKKSEIKTSASSADASATTEESPKAKKQQLGFYKEEENANASIQRLKEKGFDAYSVPEKRKSGTTYYAVVVDENAEGTMGQKLKNAGFECYPVFE